MDVLLFLFYYVSLCPGYFSPGTYLLCTRLCLEILVPGRSTSCVNFIVGCIEFILVMYVSNSDFVPVQMMNIINVPFHVCIYTYVSFNCFSSVPMNRFAYEGAILVPIAVPYKSLFF